MKGRFFCMHLYYFDRVGLPVAVEKREREAVASKNLY